MRTNAEPIKPAPPVTTRELDVVELRERLEVVSRQLCPGLGTALAFGRDRRLPITNRWREPLDHGDWLATVATLAAGCADALCTDDSGAQVRLAGGSNAEGIIVVSLAGRFLGSEQRDSVTTNFTIPATGAQVAMTQTQTAKVRKVD